ncbi:MAG: PolC-type DNA polymerase III N-terminal domain-containing protein, partial [Paraclostridium sp.]
MESIKEYLERLEINNNILVKQLEDVNITKVTYFKEEKLIYIYLSSKNIISYENLNMLCEELKMKLTYFNDVKIKIRYIKLEKQKTKDIIKKYWSNILYILKTLCPSISGWSKHVEHMCIDDTLKIKIPDELFYTRLMNQNAIQVLKNIFNEELGLDIEVIFEKSANKRTDVNKLIKKNDSMIEEIVKERMAEVRLLEDEEQEVYGNESVEIVEPVKEEYIYGENVNAPIEKIVRIN